MASTLRIASRVLPRASGSLCRATAAAAPIRVLGAAPLSRRQFSRTAGQFDIIKKFTEDHEWIAVDTETNIGTLGITDFAQDKLGEVVFIELPQVGQEVAADDSVGAVESVKSASDIMTPVDGTVVEVNSTLNEKPKQVNEDPEGEAGWIVKLELADAGLEQLNELMDKDAYDAFISE